MNRRTYILKACLERQNNNQAMSRAQMENLVLDLSGRIGFGDNVDCARRYLRFLVGNRCKIFSHATRAATMKNRGLPTNAVLLEKTPDGDFFVHDNNIERFLMKSTE